MNIPALPPTTTSSIAGVDRAVAEKVAISSTASNSTANPARHQTVDSIDKGNASEDSGADGRQTLDTFERQSQDESPEVENEDSPAATTDVPHDLSGARLRLDFQA